MPRISVPDKDKERGKRFKEICKSSLAGLSMDKIGQKLGGYSSSRICDWQNGDSIACKALGEMAKMGIDLRYLLAGDTSHFKSAKHGAASIDAEAQMDAHIQRVLATPPEQCPNRGACLIQAKQLKLLAGIFSLLSSADEKAVALAIGDVQTALLRAVKRSRRAAPEEEDEGSSPGAAHA